MKTFVNICKIFFQNFTECIADTIYDKTMTKIDIYSKRVYVLNGSWSYELNQPKKDSSFTK